jgi:hypothetical protein
MTAAPSGEAVVKPPANGISTSIWSLASLAAESPRIYGRRVPFFPIPRDSNIFVEPMDGFRSELKTAYLKEGVPLDIVTDKTMAA